jgi:hypothetical protein
MEPRTAVPWTARTLRPAGQAPQFHRASARLPADATAPLAVPRPRALSRRRRTAKHVIHASDGCLLASVARLRLKWKNVRYRQAISKTSIRGPGGSTSDHGILGIKPSRPISNLFPNRESSGRRARCFALEDCPPGQQERLTVLVKASRWRGNITRGATNACG